MQQKSNKKLKDFKGVRTTTILKETFDRENRVSLSIEKLKDIKRINAFEQATYKAFFFRFGKYFPPFTND